MQRIYRATGGAMDLLPLPCLIQCHDANRAWYLSPSSSEKFGHSLSFDNGEVAALIVRLLGHALIAALLALAGRLQSPGVTVSTWDAGEHVILANV